MQDVKKILGMMAVLALVGAGCSTPAAAPSDGAIMEGEDSAMMEEKGDAMMEENGIYGVWTVTHAEGEAASLNEGTVYTIVEDTQEFSTKKAIFETKGTISALTDDGIEVMFEGYDVPYTYTYLLDGGVLTLEVDNSGGQVLTLERQ